MGSRSDIQAYIDRAGLSFREVDEKTWIVRSSADEENIVLRIQDPLLLFRVKVFELAPSTDEQGLFRKLLELNASDLVHSSYGIADGAVIMTSALVLDSADYEEFRGAVDDITLALANHYETLSQFRAKE